MYHTHTHKTLRKTAPLWPHWPKHLGGKEAERTNVSSKGKDQQESAHSSMILETIIFPELSKTHQFYLETNRTKMLLVLRNFQPRLFNNTDDIPNLHGRAQPPSHAHHRLPLLISCLAAINKNVHFNSHVFFFSFLNTPSLNQRHISSNQQCLDFPVCCVVLGRVFL